MTADTSLAWYVYAVVPDGAQPQMIPPEAIGPGASWPEAILPGACLTLVADRGVAAVVSLVPLAPFVGGDTACLAADPGWVAARAAAHHRVVADLHAQGACLPLGYGTLFSGEDSLRRWLDQHRARLLDGLQTLAGTAEWGLSLSVDPAGFSAFATGRDSHLARLQQEVSRAGAGTAFLLGKRLARARQAVEASCFASVCDDISASCDFTLMTEAAGPGAAARWSLLAPQAASPEPWRAAAASRWQAAGIGLTLTGPFPPYAFARAALEEHRG